MSTRIMVVLAFSGLFALSACVLDDGEYLTTDDDVAWSQSSVEAVDEDDSDSGDSDDGTVGDVCPASDDDAAEPVPDCAGPVVCACKCNGVAVPVTIDPVHHGETCAQVNGRPCNTGAGWFTYNGC